MDYLPHHTPHVLDLTLKIKPHISRSWWINRLMQLTSLEGREMFSIFSVSIRRTPVRGKIQERVVLERRWMDSNSSVTPSISLFISRFALFVSDTASPLPSSFHRITWLAGEAWRHKQLNFETGLLEEGTRLGRSYMRTLKTGENFDGDDAQIYCRGHLMSLGHGRRTEGEANITLIQKSISCWIEWNERFNLMNLTVFSSMRSRLYIDL